MKKTTLLAALALLSSAPVHAQQTPKLPVEGDWKLTWSAEFDGDKTSWDTDWESQNSASTHILSSRWRENVEVKDGTLRLLNRKEKRGGNDWTSGSIWTKREFQYGYFECRYRYGAATGLNNSFWLMTRGAEEEPGRFEIDVNEGHFPNEVNTNTHRWSGKHIANPKKFVMDTPNEKGETPNFSRDYITVGLLWTEKELVWFFNGREIRREPNTFCHRPSPVWLSSAVFRWAGEVTDKIDGTQMEVDYVRVYSKEMNLQKALQPLPETARFTDPNFYIWCGSPIKGEDGQYHLFYSRWPKKLGFNAWVTHSEVARAVSKSPFGPFHHAEVVLPARGAQFWDGLCTHNPTIHKFGNQYFLYYMGNTGDGKNTPGLNWTHRNNQRIGVAVADTLSGPWRRFDAPIIGSTPGYFDALCCANPSVVARPAGGFLMVYKAVADKGEMPFGGPVTHCVALSDSPTGPFKKQPEPIFQKTGVHFPAEDPFVWVQNGRYFAVVKDFGGHFTGAGQSLALFESGDGLHWQVAKNPLVSGLEVKLAGGGLQKLKLLERPQLLIENGVPTALYCAYQETNGDTGNLQIRIDSASL